MDYIEELRALADARFIVTKIHDKIIGYEFDTVREYLTRVEKHLLNRAAMVCVRILRDGVVENS
jgi:hypothetical protein